MKIEKINKEWYFWKNRNAFALLWNIPDYAKKVEIPHDAMQSETTDKYSKNGGNTGFYDGDQYCYVKKIFIPKEDQNKIQIIKFEGVYMNAFVYINEQFAGKCPNGYSTFYITASKYLRYGEENEIRVLVKNGAMPNSRWYTGSGIYRDVYWLKSGLVHFPPEGIRIKTDYIKNDTATLLITTEVANESTERKKICLENNIKDKLGKLIEKGTCNFELESGEKRCVRQRIVICDAKLWSDENPYLYVCESVLKSGTEILDTNSETFGIRKVSVDAANGLLVNGREVKLRGACIHNDSGILGAATYEEAEYRRIRKMKEAGFNAIRMAHNPMAPATLRACDKIGMYVMDELSDAWSRGKADFDYSLFFEEWWSKDVEAMVKKDYNHPSVIMYSAGNEIPEIGTLYGEKMCSQIAEKFRSMDSDRFVTVAINGFLGIGQELKTVVKDVESKLGVGDGNEENVNQFLAKIDKYADEIGKHKIIGKCLERVDTSVDIVGYNYMASRYESDSMENPQRVIVGSETYPPVIARNWGLVKKLKNVIGDFTWTGWDYIGEAGIGVCGYKPGEGGIGAEYPCRLAYCGDFDITGDRRPQSYLREIVFGMTEKPYIAVQNPLHYGEEMFPSPWILSDSTANWTWNGIEGETVVVEVYSAGDEVELYLNGEKIGSQTAGETVGYRALFTMQYYPGELKAISYKNGRIIGTHILSSNVGEYSYRMKKEEGDQGIIFVDIIYCDETGRRVYKDQEISVSVSGAKILGFGGGDPKTEYAYNGSTTKTWNGKALLVLKRAEKSGEITVEIEAVDGKRAELTM